MYLLQVLFTTLFASIATAVPILNETSKHSFQKRTLPAIDPTNNYDETQMNQIQQGFLDALELANYVVRDVGGAVNTVLPKYFNPADHDLVLGNVTERAARHVKLGGSDVVGARALP